MFSRFPCCVILDHDRYGRTTRRLPDKFKLKHRLEHVWWWIQLDESAQ